MKAACCLFIWCAPKLVELAGCVLLLYPATPPPQPPLPTPYSVSVSCHFPSGMEPEGPYDLGRSSDRRFPVKKPCFPQYRNRSLDCPAGTRCMYLFHLLLGCAAWRPCCMRRKKEKKKKRLKPLATLKIKLILLKVLRKLCQSQLWFPWHATALHMDESCRTYPLHACSGSLWLADWRKRS